MASSNSDIAADTAEVKTEARRRKFKPFSAIRRWFGRDKKKSREERGHPSSEVSSSSVPPGRDTGDGPQRLHFGPMGGHRSMSEDSVFSPDPTRPAAVTRASVENLPKSAFQAELFNKLSNRRSLYSDDDDDDQTGASTVADGQRSAHGKHESNSSADTENEEDDPFVSKWKSPVPSKVAKVSREVPDPGGPLDLDKLGHTELLKSDMAKGKISVKPKARKATRNSRKKRNGQSGQLTSVSEEMLTVVGTDTVDDGGRAALSTLSVNEQPKEPTSVPPPEADTTATTVTTSQQQQQQQEVEEKVQEPSPLSKPPPDSPAPTPPLVTSPTPISPADDIKVENVPVPVPSSQEEAALTQGSEALAAAVSTAEPSAEKLPQVEADLPDAGSTAAELASTSIEVYGGTGSDAAIPEPPSSPVGVAKETLEPAPVAVPSSLVGHAESVTSTLSDGEEPKSTDASSFPGPTKVQITVTEVEQNVSAPAEETSSIPTSSSSPSSSASPDGAKKGLRLTDSEASDAFSPKEDYKLRRQARSKTLPGQPVVMEGEKQTVIKVQRTASQHRPAASSQAKPPGNVTTAGEGAKSTQPEWVALANRKSARLEAKEESDSSSPQAEAGEAKESVPTTSLAVTDSPASATSVVSTRVETDPSSSRPAAGSSVQQKASEASADQSKIVLVETTPTTSHLRSSSVKVTSIGSRPLSSGSVSPERHTAPSSQLSSTPAKKEEEKKAKEEPDLSQPYDWKNAPKWKTQSAKTISSTSSGISTSRFTSVKTSSQPRPLTTASSTTTSSPSKSAEEKKDSGVPAGRSGLSQKKMGTSDVKIELIETSAPSRTGSNKSNSSSSSGGGGGGVTMRSKEGKSGADRDSKVKSAHGSGDQPEPRPGSDGSKRHSKVLDLLKNFENMQAVS